MKNYFKKNKCLVDYHKDKEITMEQKHHYIGEVIEGVMMSAKFVSDYFHEIKLQDEGFKVVFLNKCTSTCWKLLGTHFEVRLFFFSFVDFVYEEARVNKDFLIENNTEALLLIKQFMNGKMKENLKRTQEVNDEIRKYKEGKSE